MRCYGITVLLFKMFRRTETRSADTVMFGLFSPLPFSTFSLPWMTVLVVYGAIYFFDRSPIAIAQRFASKRSRSWYCVPADLALDPPPTISR